MNNSSVFQPLLEPLTDVQKWMKTCSCPWMIIGGLAIGLLAKPRFTADVDLVIIIEEENLAKVLESAAKHGFSPRVKDVMGFARQNRVVLLTHMKSRIKVDVSLGVLPFEKEAIERSKVHKIGKIAVRIPTPEDLIIFKAVAHRPQDLLDIRNIVEQYPTLNKAEILKTIKEFSLLLEMPEILKDTKNILG